MGIIIIDSLKILMNKLSDYRNYLVILHPNYFVVFSVYQNLYNDLL